MKKVKLILAIIIICIIVGWIIAFSINKNINKINAEISEYYNGLPINNVSALWSFDTSTPEKAVGAYDYVFVAKVNGILRTEYKNHTELEINLFQKETISDPYTIYSISIIKNIKGELNTTSSIEFMQYGGISEDGNSYIFLEGTTLLNENEYYILMGNTWIDDDSIIEGSNPNARILLGNEDNFNSNSTDIIQRYIKAYQAQEIPETRVNYPVSKYDVNYEG